jgi:tRNA U34 2-thiouridine synthase MnmA/TrmU
LIQNCTISDNNTGVFAGGTSGPAFVNVILYDNTTELDGESSSTYTIDYSDVKGCSTYGACGTGANNIDAENNAIIVGTKNSLIIKNLQLRDLNILGEKKDFDNYIYVKIRSTGKLLKAKIEFNRNLANVILQDGEAGISPGQACVFYSRDDYGDKLLGGGWIYKTVNKNLST